VYRTFRLICIALIAAVVVACHHPPMAAPRKLAIGIQMSPAMAMIMVAKDREFFAQQGLDVELKPFTAGKFALQALLGGSLDIAVSGDVPVALAVLQGNDVRVVGQVVAKTTNEVRVVARRDPDAASAADFFKKKRRKLATSIGGGPEFYTYNFLRKYGIASADIEIVSQRPEDMPAALLGGSIDAISVFDPFAFLAESRLGPQGVTFRDDGLYSELYVLAARKELVSSSVMEATLRALKAASADMQAHPDDAKSIVAGYTKLERSVIDGIWSTFDFHLVLERSLTAIWNSEATWARETGKTTAPANPDFASIIAPEALRKVDPALVHLE
jgi:NitT/TauT family transport system substrate-binding protein